MYTRSSLVPAGMRPDGFPRRSPWDAQPPRWPASTEIEHCAYAAGVRMPDRLAPEVVALTQDGK
ncbi:hypothetical protein [Winogradskya humida]|uniref:Uncharacterized protein n=1 Tax=Winogradskya humida TaxID=113566 RepID=A0ABQ3ZUL0_9ACTN|nr:hypothetical protein [Actinoplanes humidus]GIE22271.1 hypothetical protein Ahu01nite_053730 [Actinoplanes humidus]